MIFRTKSIKIETMRLREYLDLKNVKANVWADQVGLPISGVYAWLAGTKPNIDNIMLIKKATNGAVAPDDWVNGEKQNADALNKS